MLFLFLIMGIEGCEDKEQRDTILPITNLSGQVVAFFDSELSPTMKSNCFFVLNDDTYHLINSMKEFQAIYSCENKLPEIDFTKYSVIVGQKKMPNSYYSVVEQNIEETEMSLELKIYVKLPADGYWPAFSQMYYWGIYPKLPNKKININIITNR